MEKKLKHLEMIQSVISRMAQNSFLIKGWSVTLTAAIFVLADKDSNSHFVFIALLPSIAFWGLDGYFLRQERLFRKLYEQVTLQTPDEITFTMKTQLYENEVSEWMGTVFSKTLIAFHLPILSVICGISVYLLFL